MALRRTLLISLLCVSILAGCGNLRRWYNGRKGPANPHSVTISWSPSTSTVQGYNVYRASPPAAAVKLTVRVVEGTQYTDTTVEAGHTYTYYITSVDLKGTESNPSGITTVTIPWTATTPEQR